MRVMVLSDVRVGDSQGLLMRPEIMEKWQRDKIAAVGDVIRQGKSSGVNTCVIAGGLFYDGFVPDSLLRMGIEALANHGIPIALMTRSGEALGTLASMALPESIVQYSETGLVLDQCLKVTVPHDGQATISYLEGAEEKTVTLLSFEPRTFEMTRTGYLIIDIQDGKVKAVRESLYAGHPFVTRHVRLDHIEDGDAMKREVSAAIEDIDSNSCLRLVLEGPVPPLSYVSHRAISETLQSRYFYVEVLDETTVDVEENELDGDLSLSAEFIRMVSSDDFLSMDEKTSIIRCGLNALNGRKLVE